MPRRRRNLPLWLRLLLRRLRSPEGKLAPLAVISIAVSVTLATGLEMASRSAQAHLDATAEAITGEAEIEITAGDVGLAETVLDLVRATPGVRAASPLVSAKLRLADQPYALNVIGVDLVAEEQVRTTAIERNGLQIRDPLRLLAVPNSVVVTQGLLDRLGLSADYLEGTPMELRVRAKGAETVLIVQGVLQPTGIAAAFSGQVALMDVFAAQELAGRAGLFDRIDVVPEEAQDVPDLIATLSASLAGLATVQRSSGGGGTGEDMLQMVRRSALMLAGAAALVACLLTYATTAQWVERQKRQLATLRAVGMEARRVQRMVLFEVAALAVFGTALGIASGIAISPAILATISKFLAVVRIEELSGISFQPSTMGLAIFVGLVAALAGSVLPAVRAGRRFTLDSLEIEGVPGASRKVAIALGATLLAAFGLLAMAGRTAIEVDPMLRVGSLFVLGPMAILVLAPSLLQCSRIVLRPVERVWPAAGHLITRFFHVRPWTFAVALAATSTLVGALVTVFLLIATITSAFYRWTESRYPAGAILVSPAPFTDHGDGELLSAATMDLIRTTPGVAAVVEQYRTIPSVVFRGHTVPLVAQSMDAMASHGHIASVGRASADLARDLRRGALAVSTGFARTFGIGRGDAIQLDTHHGARTFEIAGTFEDFGDATGSILLDLGTYDSCWKRSGAWVATIWSEDTAEDSISAVRQRVGERQDLYFADASELATLNRAQADVFTSTLQVLGAFISSLGAIGVLILLVGIVAERRRDLAILRAAGAEPLQLVTVVLIDALILGLIGSACGCALGYACAIPAADVLRESYGWLLEQRWTAPELPFLIAGTVVSAVLGALIPARMAFRTSTSDVSGPE